jgi:hypothetical protein
MSNIIRVLEIVKWRQESKKIKRPTQMHPWPAVRQKESPG